MALLFNLGILQRTVCSGASPRWLFVHLSWLQQLIWLFYPETANRHLEDIDRLYHEDKSMIFVLKNKEAIQVERPQRFIDANNEHTPSPRTIYPLAG